MVDALQKSGRISRKGPVVLVIMDGVGIGKYKEGDAVVAALTKNLDALKKIARTPSEGAWNGGRSSV